MLIAGRAECTGLGTVQFALRHRTSEDAVAPTGSRPIAGVMGAAAS
jgi:hypothetical protein